MPGRDISSRRRQYVPLALAALLAVVLSGGVALNNTHAQSTTTSSVTSPNPATSFKVPPLPTGSGHVQIQPGMSKKDWHDAYKETGRPKFNLSTVKRAGGTVERD